MLLKEKLGYACINTELQSKKVKTSRTMRKDKFIKDTKLELVSELSIQNLKDLRTVVRWNVENNINFYRITSNLFPWWSEYQLEDLPNFNVIKGILEDIGNISKDHNQRLTFHPGHFTILASKNPKVVDLAMLELEQHSKVFDLMGFKPSVWNKLNIHIGTAQGGLEQTADRFIDNFMKLSENCQKRITLENDDKLNMWSVKDLYDLIYERVNIPIVFDLHHHRVGADSGLSEGEAMRLALSTWGDVEPIIHFSSSKKDFEDGLAKSVAHADFVYESLNDYYIPNIWVMVEAKMKEQAVLEYRKNY
ncbi:MAG: UV DNA damage repair endonuclease UvsE [bacterium]